MSVNQVNQTTGALSPIAGGTLYADIVVGSILPFGGSTAPNGFLLCQGQSLLRTDYPELFAVIGTSFGSVDSTHFNIPDLRDKFPEGASNTNTLGSAKSAGLPNITGNASIGYNDNSAIGVMTRNANGAFTTQTDGPTYWSGPAQNVGTTYGNSFHFDASRSNSIYGKSTTVQPPSVCVNFIIKATTIALPSDFASSVDDAIDAKLEDKRMAKIGRSVPVILPTANISGNSFIPFPCFIAPSKTVVVNFYIPGIMNPTDISCSTTSDLSQGDYCVILTTNSTIIANAGKTCLMTIKSIS